MEQKISDKKENKFVSKSSKNFDKVKEEQNIRLLNFPLVSKTFFDFKNILAKTNEFATEDVIKEFMSCTESLKIISDENHRNMVIQILYAKNKIWKMWKDEKTHNFIKHLFITFGFPEKCSDEPTETTNKNIKFCPITNLFVTSKSEILKMTEDFKKVQKELNLSGKPLNEYPSKLYKYYWSLINIDMVGQYSKESDKILSYPACGALRSVLKDLVTMYNKEAMEIVQYYMGEKGHLPIQKHKMKTQKISANLSDEQIEKLKSAIK